MTKAMPCGELCSRYGGMHLVFINDDDGDFLWSSFLMFWPHLKMKKMIGVKNWELPGHSKPPFFCYKGGPMAPNKKVKHGVVSLILSTPAVFKSVRGLSQKILNILLSTLCELLNFSFLIWIY